MIKSFFCFSVAEVSELGRTSWLLLCGADIHVLFIIGSICISNYHLRYAFNNL